MQVLKRNPLPHSPLLWLVLLAALWACLGAQTLGLKTASGQIYGLQAASWESTPWQAAPRLGLRASASESVSAPPVGANGGVGASKPLVTHQPLDDLLTQANKPINDTGLSQATRAWDKHDTSRPGGTFDPLTGNTAVKNEYVNNWMRDLLTNPQTTRTNLPGGAVEYRLPNGQGVRFESSGSVNFVDPRRP